MTERKEKKEKIEKIEKIKKIEELKKKFQKEIEKGEISALLDDVLFGPTLIDQ